MQVDDLQHTLDERLDSSDINIVLQRAEEQVEVQCLFRRGDQPRVEERLVQGPVKSFDCQMFGHGELLDKHQRLDAGIEV